jgi:transcriptional regulator with XRE-family HTH domain
MQNICQEITEKRKKLGLSIAQISKELRIRKTYIEQIEEEKADFSDPYIKGYLKTYANLLGISTKEFSVNQAYNDVKVNKLGNLSGYHNKSSYKVHIMKFFVLITFLIVSFYLMFAFNEQVKEVEKDLIYDSKNLNIFSKNGIVYLFAKDDIDIDITNHNKNVISQKLKKNYVLSSNCKSEKIEVIENGRKIKVDCRIFS